MAATIKQREVDMIGEIDAMEKSKDFALAAQVSELQWLGEALGRGLRDLGRLRDMSSDAVVVVEVGSVLEKRGELERAVRLNPAETSMIRLDHNIVELRRALASAGKIATETAPPTKVPFLPVSGISSWGRNKNTSSCQRHIYLLHLWFRFVLGTASSCSCFAGR